MQEMNGENYTSSKYAKALAVSLPKDGKTCFLVANALGLLPWQKEGGLVDRPESLHVITFDANAFGGVKLFLQQTCKSPLAGEALKRMRIYNMQDDARQAFGSDDQYDAAFYNTFLSVLDTIAQRSTQGIPVVIVSSLTGLAQAIKRGVQGPPVQQMASGAVKKGSGMDMSKWEAFAARVNEIRNYTQIDKWHCLWEGHIYKPPAKAQKGGDDEGDAQKETLQIDGKSGQNFAYNVEQVFRIRRQYGSTHPGTACDLAYLDTRPSLDFLAGGRNYTEALEPKEYDMTKAFRKLGLKVGHWGHSPAKPVAKPAVNAAPRRSP